MASDEKVAARVPLNALEHGTPAWFDMVGALMVEAALQARPGPPADLCLVERFIDGRPLEGERVQGLRFEIAGGRPAYRRGAGPDERGDVTIAVSAAASRRLNTLRADDPGFPALFAQLQATGELKVEGELAALGAWFDGVHDRIVARTR